MTFFFSFLLQLRLIFLWRTELDGEEGGSELGLAGVKGGGPPLERSPEEASGIRIVLVP